MQNINYLTIPAAVRSALPAFVAVAWLLIGIGTVQAQPEVQQLKPISIAYTVSLVSEKYGNATLGRAQITLSKSKQGYSVVSVTKAEGMAAILMGSNIQESCDFNVNDGRAVSNNYAGGGRAANDYEVSFDWPGRKINFADGESLDMPQGYVVDNCNLPFAAALLKGDGVTGQTIYVLDGKMKRIRGYILKSSGPEILSTKTGNIDTIKMVLERELIPERTFTLWLSPGNSYVPLKMEDRRPSRATTMMVDQIDS